MDNPRKTVDPQQLAQQEEYAAMLSELLAQTYETLPMVFIRTYGCQGNEADSERMAGQLLRCGFVLTKDIEQAKLILFNTCAVREHAEDRAFGNVGHLKQRRRGDKHLRVGLCGCMVQQEHVAKTLHEKFPFVDLVFGTHAVHRLPELLYRMYATGRRVYEISDEPGSIAEGLPIQRESGFKAFVPIMYGCDNFCSYCVVPLVRGRERSRVPELILQEVRELVAAGYKEITLLGQNVNSYKYSDYDFTRLLKELNEIPGDYWLRFMTSHPKDCTPALLDAMAQSTHIARHLHLPVQAGNDEILHAMNRGYTAAHYASLAEYARGVMPDISLTSDIIVGFPGETYEQFQDTLRLVEQTRFASLFTFIFSPREGTAAAKLPDAVERSEKVRWFEQLTSLQNGIGAEICASFVGQTVRVLCESAGKRLALAGRAPGNQIIEFDGPEDLVGQFVTLKVTQADSWHLTGAIQQQIQ